MQEDSFSGKWVEEYLEAFMEYVVENVQMFQNVQETLYIVRNCGGPTDFLTDFNNADWDVGDSYNDDELFFECIYCGYESDEWELMCDHIFDHWCDKHGL